MRFLFLADMQLGAYASFSGLSEEQVEEYARRDMRVAAVPAVRGLDWDADCYRRAIAAANRLQPDLVVIGGDMVDDPRDADQREEFMRITRGLDAAIPVRLVPGNHDAAFDARVPTPASLTHYRRTFGADFYGFDQGGIHFTVFNTVVAAHPEEVPGEWENQLAFLGDDLAAARRRGLPTVVIGHHPLCKRSPDEEGDYWNLPRERRRVLLDLFHDHGVTLALAGHWHRNSVVREGNLEIVTAGPVGYPLGSDPSGFLDVQADSGGKFSYLYRPLS